MADTTCNVSVRISVSAVDRSGVHALATCGASFQHRIEVTTTGHLNPY